jgi:hypothetical protein
VCVCVRVLVCCEKGYRILSLKITGVMLVESLLFVFLVFCAQWAERAVACLLCNCFLFVVLIDICLFSA